MDKRVYLLMFVSFIAGMSELIIVGILDLVANDLHISLSQAGLLITVFSITFAISAPILLVVTSRMERKKLTLLSLFVFFGANILASFSTVYALLIIARILAAISGSLLVVLSITIVSRITEVQRRGKAIGLVFMGISGSLVLGVPIGLMIGNRFGWQSPFLFISILTVIATAGIYFLMEPVTASQPIPLKTQWDSLKERKVLFAHVTTFLFLAGHYTLYGYLSPFLKTVIGLNETWVTITYWIFGIAAVTGGGLGGTFADRLGAKPTILTVIVVFVLTLFVIPFTAAFLPFFLVMLAVWGIMSWALAPPLQNHLITIAPGTSDVQQSLNNSALHLGIALGSLNGSLVVEHASIEWNAAAGAVVLLFALGSALISFHQSSYKQVAVSKN
ncbi:MFS transporter [Bacillus piscicola]|uniref:MFS transporter n=1 Tax=Bacillus piscicola TaxID=1632684 RepID=UPI001F08A459|nr:MFS transporter [Bacillus piscicola]